jgi:hypothetical protein
LRRYVLESLGPYSAGFDDQKFFASDRLKELPTIKIVVSGNFIVTNTPTDTSARSPSHVFWLDYT